MSAPPPPEKSPPSPSEKSAPPPLETSALPPSEKSAPPPLEKSAAPPSEHEYEGLTEMQLNTYKEVFTMWDKHQSGLIALSEFPVLWRCIGQNPTDTELQEIMDAVPVSSSDPKAFSVDDFLKVCEGDWMKDSIRDEELIEAFKVFYKDGTGTITVQQLRYMLQCLGDKLDDLEADEFIDFVDKEKVGEIDYEKIVEALMERDTKSV